MNPLVQYIRKSLFFRLLAIFGITVVLFLIIILISLQSIGNDSDTIETIPDYFTRHVESIIEDIGTPPNLSNAMRLASELSWTINIRNPIMEWSSDAQNRLDVDSSQYQESLTSDAEMRTINGEDIIRVKRDGYDFYMYRSAQEEGLFNYFVLYTALALAALILFLNYFMVNKMLNPVRLLKQGAERIRQGDLSYRVKSNLQAELGDDEYGEDPTVNNLQEKCAELLGFESGLFVSSGLMGNQISLLIHNSPGTEVITTSDSHIKNYEHGAASFLSRVQFREIDHKDGALNLDSIKSVYE